MAPRRPRTNLPIQLTTFVGREVERAEVKRLLAGARLLTLTGTGGVGKTRLALEVAAELVDEEPGGAWLVELAPLADPTLVPQAVASALQVGEAPGRPLVDTLTSFLGPRQLLLVLDNCEHLAAACAELADRLLRGCPRLRVLATSREPLGVPGETVWRVPSLAVPDPRVAIGTDELAAADAVRLFMDRARAALPGFRLGDSNAAGVAQICHRLDGIPLAIELAAARAKVLSVEQIAARLDDRFKLLTGGSRVAPSRQQTLRATLDWSYELLSEPERILFRRLAVFAGGWTLGAAEEVCGGDGIDGGDVLEVLGRLVDKSMVLADTPSGEARYWMLETVREYSRQHLIAGGEAEALRRRHADYFCRLAEEAEPALWGPDQPAWVARLELEHDNLRAALGWVVEVGDTERGLRLGRALWRFWQAHGHLTEGRRWLARLLALPTTADLDHLRVDVLFAAGRLALDQGDVAAARPLLEECHVSAQQSGDLEHVAAALTHLGSIAFREGGLDRARVLLEEGLAIRRRRGLRHELAVPLIGLGSVAYAGGDRGAARSHYEEALAVARELGERRQASWALQRLAELAMDERNFTAARSYARECLELGRELGDRGRIAAGLAVLAELAAARSHPDRAIVVAAAAQRLRDEVGVFDGPHERLRMERALATARARLGPDQAAGLWEAGRAMSLERAVECALDVGDAGPTPDATAPARLAGAVPVSPLTGREREVAVLIARGLTNREISEALVIAERTAEAHVTHVLDKLGLRSRSQVAVWAHEHGLLAPETA